MFEYNAHHFVFAGDVAPDVVSGLGNGGNPDVLDDAFPSSVPNPNLAVGVGGENLIVGDLQRHHHGCPGLELVALGELRELPDADDVGLGACVDEAVGDGDGQDLAVLFEDGGDASVGGVEGEI